ncbi:MAG: hypothetical protein KatS3mg082_0086 [Nitrospiraceae bacterium]|nr:MAG: hypothetical protein KatS3mg082_0086 [Nitrospiraceae bacterium]
MKLCAGWSSSTTGMTSYKKLPAEAKRYLTRVEELAGLSHRHRLHRISKRDQTIILRNPLTARSRKRPR